VGAKSERVEQELESKLPPSLLCIFFLLYEFFFFVFFFFFFLVWGLGSRVRSYKLYFCSNLLVPVHITHQTRKFSLWTCP
jgi:hypothetical protein